MSQTGLNWTPENPRFLADLTGDGRADIVGFGDSGVWVALNNGDGTFQPPNQVLAHMGLTQGWRVEAHPRFLADLTGDRIAKEIKEGLAAAAAGGGALGAGLAALAAMSLEALALLVDHELNKDLLGDLYDTQTNKVDLLTTQGAALNVPANNIPPNVGITVDDTQPYPVTGWVEVKWVANALNPNPTSRRSRLHPQQREHPKAQENGDAHDPDRTGREARAPGARCSRPRRS